MRYDGGTRPSRLGQAVPERQVEEVLAVEMQHVEEERRHRHLGRSIAEAGPGGRAGGGLLERAWSPGLVERHRLAVQDEGPAGSAGHLDHVRQPVGDRVKTAGR